MMELAQVLKLKVFRNGEAVLFKACVLNNPELIELLVNILFLIQSLDHTVAHGVQGDLRSCTTMLVKILFSISYFSNAWFSAARLSHLTLRSKFYDLSL